MNTLLRISALIAVLWLIVAGPGPALAAWPNQPTDNLPVCSAANEQLHPSIVSDGAGGAIVTWVDYRSGNPDIYAQHVLASGTVDPVWPADGRALSTAPNEQSGPAIATDGAGGAIVVWEDSRTGFRIGIYAQHVLASGVVDAAWPVDGLALSTNASDKAGPTIVADGVGGAMVTWHEYRVAARRYDIYAQHALASGTVDPAWPTDGRALSTAANDQLSPMIVGDGEGGAIVTWYDLRSGTSNDIYAQHVLASGTVDPAWPADGRAVSTAANDQLSPMIGPDGAGGAIVVWSDRRNGNFQIYAQHVLAFGAVDSAWPADGRALSIAANDQFYPQIVADGAGGAIVTWQDYRSGTSNDIYAQHVLASGVADPAWPADGRALSTAANDQSRPAIAADGAGGAIITWPDLRNGTNSDIYAQHVLASGAVDPAWSVDGNALSTAADEQFWPAVVADGAGGAIVTWQDFRTGGLSSSDIYAQQVAPDGSLGTTDVPGGALPHETTLERPRPNPALGATKLRFELPRGERIVLEVYDAHGRRVRELMRGLKPAGEYSLTWDLRDDRGSPVGTGLYFVSLQVEGERLVQKLAKLR